MKLFRLLGIAAVLIGSVPTSANATIIPFDLRGTAGFGLLAANEPSLPFQTNASGGEVGAGITFDDISNLLTINVGWGSSQGFNDLSSQASNSHIHGPTASINGNGFTQTAAVLFSLTRSSNAVTGGIFTSAPITLTAAQATDLLGGKYYINIHTANNAGGELRGFLVQAASAVPEPSSLALVLAGGIGFMFAGRGKRSKPR